MDSWRGGLVCCEWGEGLGVGCFWRGAEVLELPKDMCKRGHFGKKTFDVFCLDTFFPSNTCVYFARKPWIWTKTSKNTRISIRFSMSNLGTTWTSI